jgi:hypothetical protein
MVVTADKAILGTDGDLMVVSLELASNRISCGKFQLRQSP